MSDRQSICLTMIVRNEAHIVHELLDLVAPWIDYWVVVDTGSDDGTQELIRNRMEQHGIPGELHERPWRDFGHNRSEAMQLSQGHCDYIWMMDADDTVEGVPQFTGLTHDCYYMLIRDGGTSYWRRQVFKDGVPWYYRGVLHEYPHCDGDFTEERLYGDYHIHSRRLGARNKDPDKYLRDAEVLLAEVNRNPTDERAVFYLAQSYHNYGDFKNALTWYARRAEMGSWEEEVFYSLMRVGECLSELDAPWMEVQDAYLRAWEYRPIRVEPLYHLAFRLRKVQRYALAYLYAQMAAQAPLPEDDRLFVAADVYEWRALDEQAVCGSWIGRQIETFHLCRRLLAMEGIGEEDRQRFTLNRDLAVPQLLEQAAVYPQRIVHRAPGSLGAEVTVSLVAGPDAGVLERTVNSLLNCCTDIEEAGRFVVLDLGLSASDRALLSQRYPFLEFVPAGAGTSLTEQIDLLHAQIGGRYWLQIWEGWRFFAPDNYIGRLTGVLQAEPGVFQAGINVGDATALTGRAAAADITRSAPGTGRYVVTHTLSHGPAMVDVARYNQAVANARAGGATGFSSATLDEVLCVKVN